MKDSSITLAVDQLRARFGADAFVIRDHWEADLFAIGIETPHEPGRLVYIATTEARPDRFDVSLELPPKGADELPYTSAGDWANVEWQEVVTLVGEHLGLE